MDIPRKTRYALRAIFELARHYGQGHVKIINIAKAQATPPRFLEAILNQLKQAGFIGAKRGRHGGYFLLRSPEKLTVGEVICSIQGPVQLVNCSAVGAEGDCPLLGNCVFSPMWLEVQEAISRVYDKTTFQDFLDRDKQEAEKRTRDYSI
ncbi:MAG TPA: Rrf2 family transcriptional regulator [Phycisphaerae bacterium]|nr:Rrf2 family transcriptional regulator [Phycisphaerae bacterium]